MNLGGQPLTVEQAKALVRASDHAFVPEAVPRLNVRLWQKLFEMKTGIFTAKLSAVWTKQDEEVVDDP